MLEELAFINTLSNTDHKKMIPQKLTILPLLRYVSRSELTNNILMNGLDDSTVSSVKLGPLVRAIKSVLLFQHLIILRQQLKSPFITVLRKRAPLKSSQSIATM